MSSQIGGRGGQYNLLRNCEESEQAIRITRTPKTSQTHDNKKKTTGITGVPEYYKTGR